MTDSDKLFTDGQMYERIDPIQEIFGDNAALPAHQP
jgi:iron uptake system EfeUOB component EfeO/EfeM